MGVVPFPRDQKNLRIYCIRTSTIFVFVLSSRMERDVFLTYTRALDELENITSNQYLVSLVQSVVFILSIAKINLLKKKN
jgi:hypothetical protein